MTESTDLERRYRRLLGLYPKSFRRERGEEMLSVLMAGAAPGQERPRRGEAANVARHGLAMRVRVPSPWEYRHQNLMLPIRMLSGLWLLILTVICCQAGKWWGLALLAPMALHFYIAWRLMAAMPSEPEAGAPAPPRSGLGT